MHTVHGPGWQLNSNRVHVYDTRVISVRLLVGGDLWWDGGKKMYGIMSLFIVPLPEETGVTSGNERRWDLAQHVADGFLGSNWQVLNLKCFVC